MFIREILEAGLAAEPRHPALVHLYIHVMEMAPDPTVAIPAADVFAEPGYCGGLGSRTRTRTGLAASSPAAAGCISYCVVGRFEYESSTRLELTLCIAGDALVVRELAP